MADIVAIRTALRAALGAIDGLRVAQGHDLVSVPAVMVGEVSVDYDKAMSRGLDELTVKIRVYASRANDKGAEQRIDEFIGHGPKSIKTALEAARGAPGQHALDGAADDLRVTGVDGYGVYDVAGQPYLGAEFTVTIWAAGS